MQFAVMEPADRDRVFVADLAPQRARLSEPKVMGFRRRPAADHAGLHSDILAVLLVAQANRLGGDAAGPAFGLESLGSTDGFSTGEKKSSFPVKATSPVAASQLSLGSSVGSIPVEASIVASLSRNAASTRSACSVVRPFFAGRLLWAQSAASSLDIKSSISDAETVEGARRIAEAQFDLNRVRSRRRLLITQFLVNPYFVPRHIRRLQLWGLHLALGARFRVLPIAGHKIEVHKLKEIFSPMPPKAKTSLRAS